MPDGIDHYWIDESTGALSGKKCEGARLVPFVPGSQPNERSACIKKKNGILEWFRELF